MAYRVKTRKEFSTIPSSTTIFSSGTTHDKWDELNTAGKIVSYTMDKISDTVYEETMTFDTYDSFIEFSDAFKSEYDESNTSYTITVLSKETV